MSKAIPTIQKYMTTSPHTIGADQSLRKAHDLLRKFNIRHLPVLRGGQLAGLMTHRDLALIERLRDVNPESVLVEEAMATEVYAVSPNAPLDEVAAEMAEKKYGCAIVVDNAHVVGIVTTVDISRALVDLLHTRMK
jgi:acetoin utilization protein AcuB